MSAIGAVVIVLLILAVIIISNTIYLIELSEKIDQIIELLTDE